MEQKKSSSSSNDGCFGSILLIAAIVALLNGRFLLALFLIGIKLMWY